MKTPRHILYCFVEGCDLEDVASVAECRFRELASTPGWHWKSPEVVNQRQPRTLGMRPDDLSEWDLGITMELPDTNQEPKGWFADVERIAIFASSIYTELGRELVIGIWDAERKISEDLFYIDSARPSLEKLRVVIGVGNAS